MSPSPMPPLTLNTKLAYWFGQIAEGLKNTTFGVFLLFYYNQVLGVSGTLCGVALFVGISIDAVTDPLMGSISDAWRSKYGRRHVFMYVAALPMAVCFFLLFNPLPDSETGRFIWLVVFVVLTRFTMTLYTVPHTALGAELTSDYNERNAIVAYRTMFSYLGTALVHGLGFFVFFAASDAYENGQLNAEAYPPFTAVLAICICVSILVSALGTRHLVPYLPKPGKTQSLNPKQILADVWKATENRSFRWLIAGFLLVSIPVGLGTSLQLYLNTFFWEIPPGRIAFILLASIPGVLIGLSISPRVMRHIEKKQALFIGSIGWALFYCSPVVLYFAGLFPAPGTSTVVIALVFFHFMAYVLLSPLLVAVSSMLADIADEHELLTDKRQEGVFFGAYSFIIKATSGAGAAVAGISLDLIRWPTGETIQTGADIPPDTLIKLALLAGPVLAIGFIPALLMWRNYGLSKARLQEIQEQIRSRASTALADPIPPSVQVEP